jgi:hypothetical protein
MDGVLSVVQGWWWLLWWSVWHSPTRVRPMGNRPVPRACHPVQRLRGAVNLNHRLLHEICHPVFLHCRFVVNVGVFMIFFSPKIEECVGYVGGFGVECVGINGCVVSGVWDLWACCGREVCFLLSNLLSWAYVFFCCFFLLVDVQVCRKSES